MTKPIETSSDPEHVIDVDGVSKIYQMGDETVVALAGVSFRIAKGEFVAVIGSSGSGKSTLMNILGGLDRPSDGRYKLGGRDVRTLDDDEMSHLRNRHIGFIFQNFQLMARATALRNVELPLVYRGLAPSERHRMAKDALGRVGLGHRLHHKPNEMSGGQRQRVAVARALVGEPSLLLADEPTGNLDSTTSKEILQLFHELHGQGNTIVLVTHEPNIAQECERVISLADGKVVSDQKVVKT